jgi:hypothetical protein
MTIRRVKAERGSVWLVNALRLFARHPATLAGMGAIIALINAVPVIGALFLTVFGPALFAGLLFAAREAQAGRRAEIGQLFAGFRLQGRLPKLVVLCLPGVAAGFVASWLIIDLFGAEALQGLATGSRAITDIAALPEKSVGLSIAGIALATLVAYLAVFFAIPQVMFRGVPPWTAMAQSLLASAANLPALLVYVLVLLVFFLATMIALGIVGVLLSALGPMVQWLVQIAAVAVLMPVALAASLQAWQDVFGELDAGADQAEEASAEM